MNANSQTSFRPLLANRYSAEAACVCGSVQTQHSQIVELRPDQIKPHPISEKMESQKTTVK